MAKMFKLNLQSGYVEKPITSTMNKARRRSFKKYRGQEK